MGFYFSKSGWLGTECQHMNYGLKLSFVWVVVMSCGMLHLY
jgi:hypothetical protein